MGDFDDGIDNVSLKKSKKRKAEQNEAGDEARKTEKREKKKLKAEKKAAKEADKAENGANHDSSTNGEAKTKETSEEKAARKAEKKRLKALKKADKANGDTTKSATPKDETEKDQDPVADATITKEEKKRLKAIKKDAKRRNDSSSNGVNHTSTNGISNGHSTSEYTESEDLSALPQSQIDEYLTKHSITVADPLHSKPLRPIIAFTHLPATTIQGQSPFATFTSPTPIQAAAWPFLLSGRDVIGVAETGSGKTLAFGVPLVRHITSEKGQKKGSNSPARAVIVSPTRELAVQIHDQISILAKSAGIEAVCVYGGVPKDPQREALRTASIITATPGRLNDLINEGSADLSGVTYMVLDEADRMLDKGFEEEIRRIISTTVPTANRQTLMFTATWPQSVQALASTFMHDPVKITIGDHASGELRANTRIEQRVEVLDTHPRSKETRLLELLRELQPSKSKKKSSDDVNRILIFALYKKEAARIEGFLQQRGFHVAGIHGDLSQERRSAALGAFKAGTTPLLVATDVAARGLDIPAVKAVINLTFPLTVEDYVHRIGRTGRAGQTGLAVTLFTEHDKALAGALVNVLKAANQPVPDELLKFGGTVKKKQHDAYGAFYKEPVGDAKATKIKFDD
jgi:ATP-dependent RNA helicase DBP3